MVNMATGKITQIIGAVVDVEFPREAIPKIYEALKLVDVDLTLEVQQQLGDGVVRTIAMGPSEGLKRGLAVEATGAAILVPVGGGAAGVRPRRLAASGLAPPRGRRPPAARPATAPARDEPARCWQAGHH